MFKIIAGVFATVGYLHITSINSLRSTSETGYELDGIAAIVIGGSSLDVLVRTGPLVFFYILCRGKKMVLLK